MEAIQNNKLYYELNKDKWKIYVDCKCGSKYNRNTRTHHLRSHRHKMFEKDERIKELEQQLKSQQENTNT